ncbi:hypothetical protein QCE49_06925 [Caballeronia sp. LZ008]|uniref:hypothetical protein n=1 Tax=unclassified Caballeronia TaxID=2646786 RepID=UPI002028000B|nr:MULTISPECIES: hypothetical protein [unclassified Caballeronia]MDR5793106.1 hypothetical protein [Caballeronia sp. LZ008]
MKSSARKKAQPKAGLGKTTGDWVAEVAFTFAQIVRKRISSFVCNRPEPLALRGLTAAS